MPTRLTTLTLAALLTFGLGALPALATPGPGTASNPTHAAANDGPGSGHEPGGSGPGNAGPGDDHGSGGPGADEPGSDDHRSGRSGSPESETGDDHGSGGPGDDRGAGGPSDGRSAPGAPSPGESLAPSHATRPERAPAADTSASTPAPPTPAASAAAPELAPPVGSVADRQAGFARLSTAPSAAVAGVVGGALLLAGMVAAGFRARARLGRLG